MKKFFKVFGIVIACITVAVGLVYLMVAFYYSSRFMPNTVVSGLNVNAMTSQEVNDLLASDDEEYSLTLYFADGGKEVIEGTDFGYHLDYTDSLNKIIASQNQFEWPYYSLYITSYEAESVPVFEEDKAVSVISKLEGFNTKYDNENATVKIINRTNHFELKDERKKTFNEEKATADVLSTISKGKPECDLNRDYDDPKTTDKQQEVLDDWKNLDKIQNAVITLSDDDITLVIDKYEFMPWFKTDSMGQPKFDSQGNVLIDDEKVEEYVNGKIADAYATDGKDRIWQKHNGGSVSLPCTWDGFVIDVEAEKLALIKSVLLGKTETREPHYSQRGNGHGNAEVGDTYVEVDKTAQKMYYYEEGKVRLTSDTVTGCVRYHNDTPNMITRIYYMEEGRTLRGENYATFVNYWMAFYNHYGLHDATWRREFGGDIYLTDGSHGCVNLPKDKAGELFELVEVGTPVIVYD